MARLNLSHGTNKTNLKLISLFAEAKRLRPHKTCAIMLDIKGREIRCSPWKSKLIQTAEGQTIEPVDFVTLECDDVVCLRTDDFSQPSTNETIFVDCVNLYKYVRPTDELYFNDGQTKGEVIDVEPNEIKIRMRSECNLPAGVQIRLSSSKYTTMPLVRGSDLNDLKEMYKKFPYEYVSIPCVQNGTDLQEFKLTLGNELADKIEVVSKIDTMEGV